jgi:hypothetical protein
MAEYTEFGELQRRSKPKLIAEIEELRARLGKKAHTNSELAGLRARTKFGLATYVADLRRQLPRG